MADKKIDNIDQIRDIIFGSQIKEFDKRFEQLDQNIKELHKEIRRSFEESHDKLRKETERAVEVLERKIDNLSDTSLKERMKLKDLINTLDESLQDKMRYQKDEFDTKLKVTKENLADEQQKISYSVQSTRDELNHILQKRLATLSDDKVSKESMAQMLLELAMKIEGTDMTTILGEGKKAEE